MTDAERRRTRRWIDIAVDHCECLNLEERQQLPGWIFDLVVVLQDANGLELAPPHDPVEAHGQLLDLREHYMPAKSDLEAPAEAEPEPEPRTCTECGRPISQPRKRWQCPACRKAKRLIKAAQTALAS